MCKVLKWWLRGSFQKRAAHSNTEQRHVAQFEPMTSTLNNTGENLQYGQVPTQVPTSVGNNSDIQIQHLQHGGWLCPYGTAGQDSNPRLTTFLTEKR